MPTNRYLALLSTRYPTLQQASAEIINLRAILSLPKGTEFFFSDLHGEHQAFIHMLRSASGVIRSKIDDLFCKSMPLQERDQLAALVYAPEEELKRIRRDSGCFHEWCKITIYRLIEICKAVSSKYTRSKVRKKMPKNFAYIIDELLHAEESENQSHYYNEIIHSIVETGMAEEFIVEICNSIGQLAVDRLHIIGDIFDRGPRADAIIEELARLHSVDIQWGNHDISWMGAATGNRALIANVLRLGISYNNFDLLEDGYGINLRPLAVFALQTYHDDDCRAFMPHVLDENKVDPVDSLLAAKMHKAAVVIQLKLEGQLITQHPEYKMQGRNLLSKIDWKKGTVRVGDTDYPLKDTNFPTVDPEKPLALSEGEDELMRTICASFAHSEQLARQIKFLYAHGSMYLCANSNLLYHGCIPMDDQGRFDTVTLGGQEYAGKKYLEYIDRQVREAFFAPEGTREKEDARDFMWYLWCGSKSPLFGKDKMATFERYFIDDAGLGKETQNPYYKLIESREVCEKILREFGLDPEHAHIINGHVPVRIKEGENPVKGGGLLYMIDGGMSKAYHNKTGIGGYTLIFNSRHLALAEHRPFEEEKYTPVKLSPRVKIVEVVKKRITVAATDTGKEIAIQISDLQALCEAYRDGQIKEKTRV